MQKLVLFDMNVMQYRNYLRQIEFLATCQRHNLFENVFRLLLLHTGFMGWLLNSN